jgi:hypothetical protein
MHFQLPCLGIMEDLTDVVYPALDSTDPPWGAVSLRSPGPELAHGGWEPVALPGPAWRSRARDASGSWDPAVTPTSGLPACSGPRDPEPFVDASFIS